MTRSEKRDLRSESENLHGERLKIIHILQNNVDKKCLIAPHEKSVQKLIESRIIRKSILRPFSRIASHIHINCSTISLTNVSVKQASLPYWHSWFSYLYPVRRLA